MMKSVVMFFALMYGQVLQTVGAVEPTIILLSMKERMVFHTRDAVIQLKERGPRVLHQVDEATFAGTKWGELSKESPGLNRLRAAYRANFLDCGPFVDTEGLKKNARVLMEWAEHSGNWANEMFTVQIDDRNVMVSKRRGAQGVVLNGETGQRLPGSPCGATVHLATVSPKTQRVAFVFDKFTAVTFFANGSWQPERARGRFVQLHQLNAPGRQVAVSQINEEVPLDLIFTDEGQLRLLTAEHRMEWWKPQNWLFALAGHASRHTDIFLYAFDASGELVSRNKIASAKDGGFNSGQFLPAQQR